MIARAGHYEPIAREGYPFIAPPALLGLIFWWFGHPWVSFAFLAVAVAIVFFFRNPERTPPTGRGLFISPADGTVAEIVEDAHSENLPLLPLKRISVFMSVFNTHVNRSPISGTVKAIKHVPGQFLDAREPASSLLNEHNSLIIQNDEAMIEVVQIAGKIARRIACWVREGDHVRQGERFGLIRFGSRLDIYLPQTVSFQVSVGTPVRAGVTVIAKAPTTADPSIQAPKS
ncbi:MAG: phosphatidylserine decarboxylase family protein [Desulfomonilaceae bacterium]